MPGRMDRPQSRGAFYSKVDERAFEKRMALDWLWKQAKPAKSSPEPYCFGNSKWYDPKNKRQSEYMPCTKCKFIKGCGKKVERQNLTSKSSRPKNNWAAHVRR